MKYPDNWSPPHVIAWRLIWIVPLHVTRVLFVAVVLCAYGPQAAARAWRETS